MKSYTAEYSNSTKTRSCPVCHTGSEKSKLFLEKNIDAAKLTQFSFASRKTPEFMCNRLVQCPICDLVYADQPPSEDELAHAYHLADYNSSEEANDAAAAYIRAIQPTLSALDRRQSVLEIGTGTGIFLEYLSSAGFTELVGVEPSLAAIAAAPIHRRPWIREAMFDEKNFAPESFDLICCFMTMEHVRDPNVIARAALRLLRPGGAFVTVTHDYHGLVNRLLGKRSPIIDIEHMQLFSKNSLQFLFHEVGYTGVTVSAFENTYSLQYWVRLSPFSIKFKKSAEKLIKTIGLGDLKVSINAGNLITSGFKGVGPAPETHEYNV